MRLKVPRLRQQTFEPAIIERYRLRQSLVEEALIEMYLAGVSVRRVEDVTERCGAHACRRLQFQTSIRRGRSEPGGRSFGACSPVTGQSLAYHACSSW